MTPGRNLYPGYCLKGRTGLLFVLHVVLPFRQRMRCLRRHSRHVPDDWGHVPDDWGHDPDDWGHVPKYSQDSLCSAKAPAFVAVEARLQPCKVRYFITNSRLFGACKAGALLLARHSPETVPSESEGTALNLMTLVSRLRRIRSKAGALLPPQRSLETAPSTTIIP
jgi:hypothetical protein